MSLKKPIVVEPLTDFPIGGSAAVGPPWRPVEGEELMEFLSRVVPEESRSSVRDAAIGILGRGVAPAAGVGQETGLVVGYVQSGKTMSFEAVATAARDNAYQVVIVVAGTSKPLFRQSTSRLRRDLQLDDPNSPRRWELHENPEKDSGTRQALQHVLEDWRDPNTPAEYKQTVLITVLKHYKRLASLTALLSSLDLRGVPVLVVDDEADQASLNTEVDQGEESATYRRFMELRRALPTHTFLQYTATPQAPLLVSLVDSLSPNFINVLEPGENYVGGAEFFREPLDKVLRIPEGDVPRSTDPSIPPPESLLKALAVFIVGVTAGLMRDRNTGNRSMLVHPSHLTAYHQQYCNWVRNVVDEWKTVLGLAEDDPDRSDLIQILRVAHTELSRTVADLPSFEDLQRHLRFAFRRTRVLEVNARKGGKTPEVNWQSAYGWILVGGQAMDRGFTVEGLTVTYMPRGIGVGNADTVQQRARFFGYKKSYFGYCRVYLSESAVDAFRAYVEHEEDVRSRLVEFQNSGRPLDDWKRAFVLDPSLQPCRRQVVENEYVRGTYSDAWVVPRIVLPPEEVLQANRSVVDDFLERLNFREDDGHPDRSEFQRHYECRGVPLRQVMDELLVRMRVPGSVDSERNTGMLLQLQRALEDEPERACTVYQMSMGKSRSRGVDENGRLANLFQGADPVVPLAKRGTVYPGDREVREAGKVAVQIHNLELTGRSEAEAGDAEEVLARDVAVLAVWVPAGLATSWLVQTGH